MEQKWQNVMAEWDKNDTNTKNEKHKKTNDDVDMSEKREKGQEKEQLNTKLANVFEEDCLDDRNEDRVGWHLRSTSNNRSRKSWHDISDGFMSVVSGGESKLVTKLKWLSTIHTLQREHCAMLGERFEW